MVSSSWEAMLGNFGMLPRSVKDEAMQRTKRLCVQRTRSVSGERGEVVVSIWRGRTEGGLEWWGSDCDAGLCWWRRPGLIGHVLMHGESHTLVVVYQNQGRGCLTSLLRGLIKR